MLGYLDISLAGSGLIGGGISRSDSNGSSRTRRIEDLPIRFAAIATEFNTGHEIWLTRGRLVEALRASYALPGIFPPVLIGGRWLVDGALVNPVPVSAARALGARLVIAVNLNADLFGRGTIIASHGSDETRRGCTSRPKRQRLSRHVQRRANACAGNSSDGAGAPAFRPSWSKPSTSCRTASRARGLPAIRRTS